MKKNFYEYWAGDGVHISQKEQDELAAYNAVLVEMAKSVTTYADYAAQPTADEDEARELVRTVRKVHDAICAEFYAQGRGEELGAHIEAYDIAKKQILSPYKRKARKPTIIVATQIYDDDDNPTSHVLSL